MAGFWRSLGLHPSSASVTGVGPGEAWTDPEVNAPAASAPLGLPRPELLPGLATSACPLIITTVVGLYLKVEASARLEAASVLQRSKRASLTYFFPSGR